MFSFQEGKAQDGDKWSKNEIFAMHIFISFWAKIFKLSLQETQFLKSSLLEATDHALKHCSVGMQKMILS